MGGIPKATLRIDGLTLLERQVSALRGAGVRDVAVVVGPYREQIEPLVARCRANLIVIGPGASELIDSQEAALREHIRQHADLDLIILLGDLPFLTTAHILRLLEHWAQRDQTTNVLVPMSHGVRGHPVILSAGEVQAIVQAGEAEVSIRAWMSLHAETVRFVEMGDIAYVHDLDTPEDLAHIGISLRHPASPS